VLGLRVTWDKRYITLGPVATLLGLAFRVYDPDRSCWVGDKRRPGHHLRADPDRASGRQHRPAPHAAQRGVPERAELRPDVFIPMDWVIGGVPMIGRGWRMLMECLAAGRSHFAAVVQHRHVEARRARRSAAMRACARSSRRDRQVRGRRGSAHPHGRQPLHDGRHADADRCRGRPGEKPAVVSAIAKYHITERAREVINDGMDVIGGKGICMGPSNFLGGAYMQHPVAITVEGANILTRSLIIFGQGAIRCHPFVLKEINATRETDREAASMAFDAALTGHLRFMLSNLARTLVTGLTGSHFVRTPADVAPETRRYYQQLTRFSAALAFLADVSMGTLGGALKRKEKLSARLGDILSLMYLCSATLKRFEAEGRQAADAPLMHWAIWDAMFKAQSAFEGVISNFPNRVIATLMRRIVFPLGRPYVVPSDQIGHEVASLLIAPSATRDRLTAGMYIGRGDDDPVALIERALAATMIAEPIEAKLKAAIREGRLDGRVPPGSDVDVLAERALAAGLIDGEEAQALMVHHDLVQRVIRVDDFDRDLGASLLLPAIDALQRQAPVRHRVAA
jgi:acyl-CoA dehydrogenase